MLTDNTWLHILRELYEQVQLSTNHGDKQGDIRTEIKENKHRNKIKAKPDKIMFLKLMVPRALNVSQNWYLSPMASNSGEAARVSLKV